MDTDAVDRTGDQDVERALAALVDGDADAARRAVAGGTSLLASALREHLAGAGGGSVYDAPAAFAAFIRGGGNVRLYAAVSAALAGLYEASRPARLLEVGCGDGAALVPALRAVQHPPAHLDLVEPSAPLLDGVVRALRTEGIAGVPAGRSRLRVWSLTAQAFVAELADADPGEAWPLAQSTFALHTVPAAERTDVLAALRPRVGVLALVEFDVPDAEVGSPEHVRFLARTYEQGLAEYDEDRDLVAQGFLMPVLTGQLRPGAVRATYEQPAERWAEQVREAGYTDVTTRVLDDYWSSPAFLLTARGTAEPQTA